MAGVVMVMENQRTNTTKPKITIGILISGEEVEAGNTISNQCRAVEKKAEAVGSDQRNGSTAAVRQKLHRKRSTAIARAAQEATDSRNRGCRR